jgi:hypothetical protein
MEVIILGVIGLSLIIWACTAQESANGWEEKYNEAIRQLTYFKSKCDEQAKTISQHEVALSYLTKGDVRETEDFLFKPLLKKARRKEAKRKEKMLKC